MNTSKRQQRRNEYLEKNKERIEKLKDKYGSSNKIMERINEIENKGSSSNLNVKDIKELEVLNSQYKVLKEFEKSGNEENKFSININIDKNNNEEDKMILSLKDKSVFWDAELNPLGKQPFNEYKLNRKFRGNYQIPFESNINEEDLDICYPKENKPQYYRIQNNKTSYSNL